MTLLLLHLNNSIVCYHYHCIFLDAYNIHKQSRRQRGGQWCLAPFWNWCPPFHVWPTGCCIHPILYLKNLAPPSGFWPLLLLNPGDGPVNKPSNKKFAPMKNQTFRWTKKCTSTLNKNRKFVYQPMSIFSNIIYAITDIHCCFSSNMISCCAACFAQIEMFLIQWCNSTVSLG